MPTAQSATAAPSQEAAASEPAWYLMIDVKRFAENPFGKDLLKLAEKSIAEESNIKDLPAMRAKIAKVIGFDPLDGIERITVYGMTNPLEGDIKHLNQDQTEKIAAGSVFVAQLRGSPGNLEGFALAMPDYQSTEYKKTTIHSGLFPQFESRIYAAIRKPEEGSPGFVIVGLREDLLKQVIDLLLARPGQPAAPVSGPVAGEAPGAFFTVSMKLDDKMLRSFLEIPQQHSAVFKMLRRLTFSLGAENESIQIWGSAETVDEKRAEQIQQLVQGLVAAIQLPIEDLEKDKEIAKIRKIIEHVTVSRSGNCVSCQLSHSAAGFLDELRRLANE